MQVYYTDSLLLEQGLPILPRFVEIICPFTLHETRPCPTHPRLRSEPFQILSLVSQD